MTADGTYATPEVVARRQRREMVLLSYALTGGVVWWIAHLVVTAAVVPAACAHGIVWALNALTIVTAVGAGSAIAASEVIRRWSSPVAMANQRNRVLGLTGVLINSISLALILLEGAPTLFLGPCR
jgi:hypothetical protein